MVLHIQVVITGLNKIQEIMVLCNGHCVGLAGVICTNYTCDSIPICGEHILYCTISVGLVSA